MYSREHHNEVPNQPLCDALAELSAGLAILSVIQRQQEAPYGTISEASIKKLEGASGSEFFKEIQVPLPDLLWALSLIFSPSRTGGDVVASAIRGKPQDMGCQSQRFTLYLTKNKGLWSIDDTKHRDKWQDAMNCKNTGMSNLRRDLFQNCGERIRGYAESAQRNLLGERNSILEQICKKTPSDSDASAYFAGSASFSNDLVALLRKIVDALEPSLSDMNILESLVEECWQFLERHGGQFDRLFAHLREESSLPIDVEFPRSNRSMQERAYLVLKVIENFAKLPRAFHIVSKFRDVLISKKAQFEIQLISTPGTSHAQECDARLAASLQFLRHFQDSMQAPGLSTSDRIKAMEIITRQKDYKPHCEVQMLQYFDQNPAERSGTWNIMGSSKRPCFACAKLLQCSDFLFKESHGKAYSQQFHSAMKWIQKNLNMRLAIRELKEDVVMRVESYKVEDKGGAGQRKYEAPDSATFLGWGSVFEYLLSPERDNLFGYQNT